VFYLLAYAAVTAILAVTIAGVWVTRSRGEPAATTMERRMLIVIGAAVVVGLAAVLLLYLRHGPFG
jgi:VIT1/CCC1 family predicted Fe2+/Mn2+ transporter